MGSAKEHVPPGSAKKASELLDMYFLEMRSGLLETAAALDRIGRAEGGAEAFRDPRMVKLRKSVEILGGENNRRAEKFLLLFSE